VRQATLVALYGPKTDSFSGLLSQCQAIVTEAFANAFRPYEASQIHGTVVGLEKVTESPGHNLNLARFRNQGAPMDLVGFLSSTRIASSFPLYIQFGGFRDRDYPFVSRGRTPFERSFSLQGENVVLIGWPVRGRPSMSVDRASVYAAVQEARLYPNSLDDIRRFALNFNVLHQYHRSGSDVDNDFYVRIGICDTRTMESASRQAVESRARLFLSTIDPIIVEISASNLYVASYVDESLPCESTKTWKLTDVPLSTEFIEGLYRD
jgi:hypothetical protein